MNKRFIVFLILATAMVSTGCRSPRLFGWRGANCGWQPRSLFRRQAQVPAFQPPAGCAPGCSGPDYSGGVMSGPGEGMPMENMGYPMVPDDGSFPLGANVQSRPAYVEQYGPVTTVPGPIVSSGAVYAGRTVAVASPRSNEVVMGPESSGIPSPP